jgi:sugar lactone lactonase YvrE
MRRKSASGAGCLYRLDPDLSVHTMLENLTIPNGIVWTADARTMYFIDTPTRVVAAFDYDLETGGIFNRRDAFKVPSDFGWPDGMTIDAEGMLWIAHWGSSEVVRWNPRTGQAIRRIKTAATQTSSCAFGGPNLDRLYITSARDTKENESHAGALFIADPGITGVVLPEFAG